MNEQIEKLARECFDVANDGNGDEYLGTTAGIEKFADLIIKECVEIVETQRVPVGNSAAGEMAAKWTMDALRSCRDEIKEHWLRLTDVELERRTGEPHIDGYPLQSGLPPPAEHMNDLLKPHQCPRCFGLFKVGDRFWNDSGTVYHWFCWVDKLRGKNGG